MYGAACTAECFATAKQAAQKALELNPALGEAHASYAFALWAADRDQIAAEREFQHGIMLRPDYPTAHQWLSLFESAAGRHDLAEASIERARASNPSSPIATVTHALCLYQRRHYERALRVLSEPVSGVAISGLIAQMRAWCLLELDRVEEALAAARSATRAASTNTSAQAVLACAMARSGNSIGAIEILNELYARSSEQYVSRYLTGCIHVALGNHTQAIRDFEAAVAAGDWWTVWLPNGPWFEPLRNDPRFKALTTRISATAAGAQASRRSLRFRWLR